MKSLTAVAIYPPTVTQIAVNTAIMQTMMIYARFSFWNPKATVNNLDRPLNSEAVYGIKKMNTMIAAANFKAFESKRLPK